MTLVLLALLFGPSIAAGMLLVRAVDGGRCTAAERCVFGAALGPSIAMLPPLFLNLWASVPLGRWSFVLSLLGLLALTAAASWKFGAPAVVLRPSPRAPRAAMIVIGILLLWTAAKGISFGVTNLFLTPTYLDDTLDNWNLRAKVFFHERAFTLDLPQADPLVARVGVSSYPPTVPLLKAATAAIGGAWDEAAANGIHLLWFFAPLALLWVGLRRLCGTLWACIGVYFLGSLPLFAVHGVSPYADAFLATHVLAAVLPLTLSLAARDATERAAWLRIGAIAAGILPFTKNEASVLYLPAVLGGAATALAVLWHSGRLTVAGIVRTACWYIGAFVLLGLPWLAYKWSLGLAFGNAKEISTLAVQWYADAPRAIAINTIFEGNWLFFFPLLPLLLALRWRDAFRSELAPAAVAGLLAYAGQLVIFTCTPLALEAIRQTGYARGVVHIVPVLVVLATVLIARLAAPALPAWARPTPVTDA